jgi:hypothetical protein
MEIIRDSVRWWGLLLVVRNLGISDHDVGPHTHRATMVAPPHCIMKLYVWNHLHFVAAARLVTQLVLLGAREAIFHVVTRKWPI